MIEKKTYIPSKPRNKKLTNTAAASLSNIRSEIHQVEGSINQKLDEVGQKVDKIKVGNNNLLRNTGFLGDFLPLEVDSLTAVLENTEVGTNPLAHWVHNNTEVMDAPSRSGKGVKIGSLQQTVNLKKGEGYVLSFKAKGESLTVILVESTEVDLTDEFVKYSFDIVAGETKAYTFGLFDTSNTAEVYEIMLSEGNTDVDYSYSQLDDLKAMSQLQAINSITSAIKNFDTDILGGLILTSMIQLGKYKDGKMEKVNAGISGLFNNDDDPAAWFGGSMEQAIRTVQRLKENPYSVSEDEWKELANIVFTHGGDGFFRGIIHALGGIFRGKVESNADGNRIVIDPEDRSMKMITETGKVVIKISFRGERQADIRFYMYNDDGSIDRTTSFGTDEGYYVQRYGVNGNPLSLIRYGNDGQIANSYLPNLTDAQADAILVTGMWYRTGRVIKVKD